MAEVINKVTVEKEETTAEKPQGITDNSPVNYSSGGDEQDEYNTASDSQTDGEEEQNEYDSENESGSLEDDENEDTESLEEIEEIDAERKSGDGQEDEEANVKKKVDHDEDRSNPQYIPKKGTFYEHDDRTIEDADAIEQPENDENLNNTNDISQKDSKVLLLTNPKVASTKLVKRPPKENDRWTHDRFNEGDQAPKSRNELVTSYGYDIRNEDCAPRSRRTRKYGRGQPKYSRNWEDEEAYKNSTIKVARKPPRAEDFPALGATTPGRRNERRRNSRQDENEPQDFQQSRSERPDRSDRAERSQRNSYSSRNDWNDSNDRPTGRDSGPRDRERAGDREREPRGQLSENRRYNNENSNNNNNRSVNGKRNINYRHNTINSVEFKSQNRSKNINSEQTQQRFNNEIPVASASFTNSKMNNANNNPGGSRGDTSRKILTFDNSSTSNYGRSSREKETNQMHNQPAQGGSSQIAPNNKNLDHEQVKLVEKSYAQSKSTNVNLNSPSQPIQNDMMALNNSGEAARPKRYSFRQRSNVNEPMIQPQGPPGQQYQQIQQQQEIQNVLSTPSTQQGQNYMQPPQMQTQPAPVPVPQQKYPPNAYYVNQAAPQQSDYASQQQQVAMAQYQYQQQQQPPPTQYIAQQQQPSQPITYIQSAPPAQPQPQQILNYVSNIQPQTAAQPQQYTPYTGYQNYNLPQSAPAPQQPPPQTAAPIQSAPPTAIYQTQSGLTYFTPTQPPQTTHQPIASHPPRMSAPQRRPIPILAPPDHKKASDDGEREGDKAADIDHILDNMFVQRTPYEPPISIKDTRGQMDDGGMERIDDGLKSMSVHDAERKDDLDTGDRN